MSGAAGLACMAVLYFDRYPYIFYLAYTAWTRPRPTANGATGQGGHMGPPLHEAGRPLAGTAGLIVLIGA